MPCLNQNAIIDKINLFLKSRNRHRVLEHGYCHGFTLLWLYHMSIGKEDTFYELTKNIVLATTGSDFDDIENETEELISHLEWMQNPSEYSSHEQLDIDVTLGFPEKIALSSVLTARQLHDSIDVFAKENLMICLSGPSHTIGLFRRGDCYFLYDPNYSDGKPKIFTEKKLLVQEIIKTLFSDFITKRLALQINIVQNTYEKKPIQQPIDKEEFLKKLTSTQEDIAATDPSGLNSLHLACENKDFQTAETLLNRTISVNARQHDGKTALTIAAANGYKNLAELLISHGAYPDLGNADGKSPLYLATKYDHIETVKVLLESGANPLKKTKYGSTAWDSAIAQKNWEIVFLMARYVKNSETLLEQSFHKLANHQQDVLSAFEKATESWRRLDKKYFQDFLQRQFCVNNKPKENSHVIRKHANNRNALFHPYRKAGAQKLSSEIPTLTELAHFPPKI